MPKLRWVQHVTWSMMLLLLASNANAALIFNYRQVLSDGVSISGYLEFENDAFAGGASVSGTWSYFDHEAPDWFSGNDRSLRAISFALEFENPDPDPFYSYISNPFLTPDFISGFGCAEAFDCVQYDFYLDPSGRRLLGDFYLDVGGTEQLIGSSTVGGLWNTWFGSDGPVCNGPAGPHSPEQLSDPDFEECKSVGRFALVPEPSTLALFGLGLLGMGYARRKKSH